jgi:hypothetical protein
MNMLEINRKNGVTIMLNFNDTARSLASLPLKGIYHEPKGKDQSNEKTVLCLRKREKSH